LAEVLSNESTWFSHSDLSFEVEWPANGSGPAELVPELKSSSVAYRLAITAHSYEAGTGLEGQSAAKA